MTEYYRVAIFSETTSPPSWSLVGPTFATREGAVEHMDTYEAVAKRVVTLNETPVDLTVLPMPDVTTPINNAVALAEAGLDAERVAFARWLVQTGRLTEKCAGYVAEALPDAPPVVV